MGSAALRVPESSLTFLKRSGSGGARTSSSASLSLSPLSSRGTVIQTDGTVNQSHGTVKNSPKADIINAPSLKLEAEERCVDGGSGGEKTPPGLKLEKGDALDSWEDFNESSLLSLPSGVQATPVEKDDAGRMGGSKGSKDRGGDRPEAADVEEDAVRVEVRAFVCTFLY